MGSLHLQWKNPEETTPDNGLSVDVSRRATSQVGRLYRTDGFLQLISDLILQLGDFFFPECVARVPVSLWGSGGTGVFA